MKFRFIAKLHHIKIISIFNRGINIFDELKISNSTSLISSTIMNEFIINMIGHLEYNDLLESTYVYAKGDTTKVEHVFNQYDTKWDRMLFLDQYMKIAQQFMTCLWLIKDNSVNTELGFLYIEDDHGRAHTINSNMRGIMFTSSNGEYIEEEFSREEIVKAVEYLHLTANPDSLRTTFAQDTMKLVNTESSRLGRFFYFLQHARGQSHIPSKISNYCTMLEVLLSTDASEITHKIAERAALFLGNNSEEKVDIFYTIKSGYKIRSSTVHGDLLSKKYKKHQTQVDLSNKLDILLRKLILKIITNEKYIEIFNRYKAEELDKWFNDEILLK